MDFPSFFSSMFGRDCSEIETDPRADPFDKEICQSFRQFEDSFNGFQEGFHQHTPEREGSSEGVESIDPESLRNSILSRSNQREHHRRPTSSQNRRVDEYHSGDKDLDDDYNNNPSAILDEILRDNESKPHPQPRPSQQPQYYSSHSSVSIKTIRKSDGSIEQYKTVRDSSGNETTTVTKTDPNGHDGGFTDEEYIPPSIQERGHFNKLYDWLWPTK